MTRPRRGLLFFLALLALAAPSVLAQANLQASLDAAAPGSTLRLPAGDHTGPAAVAHDLVVFGVTHDGTRLTAAADDARVATSGALAVTDGAHVVLSALSFRDVPRGLHVANGVAELLGVGFVNVAQPVHVAARGVALMMPGAAGSPPMDPQTAGPGFFSVGAPHRVAVVDGRGEAVPGATLTLVERAPDGAETPLVTWQQDADGSAPALVPRDPYRNGVPVPVRALALVAAAPGHAPQRLALEALQDATPLEVTLAATAGPVAAYVAAAVLALVTLAAAVAVRFDVLRYRVGLLAAPLFTRLVKGRLLEQPTRERVHRHIADHPGIHYRELRRALRLPNGVVAHHLRVLTREGFVREKREGQYLRYWAAGVTMTEAAVDTATRLVAIVQQQPGVSGSELAKALAASPSLVSYHLEKLEQAGRIARTKEGRRVRVYPLDG